MLSSIVQKKVTVQPENQKFGLFILVSLVSPCHGALESKLKKSGKPPLGFLCLDSGR